MPTTEAQEEFNALINGSASTSAPHPEDQQRVPSPTSSPEPQSSSSKMGYSNTIRSSTIHHDSSDSDTATIQAKSKTFLPRMRSQANTGPKGVIADAQAFHRAKRAHRSAAASRSNVNSTSPPLDGGAHWDADAHRAGSEELEDDGEHDTEFMATWRQRRMQELLATQGRGIKSSGGKKGVVKVDAEGYLHAVERAPREAVVVVYIYDDKVCLFDYFSYGIANYGFRAKFLLSLNHISPLLLSVTPQTSGVSNCTT